MMQRAARAVSAPLGTPRISAAIGVLLGASVLLAPRDALRADEAVPGPQTTPDPAARSAPRKAVLRRVAYRGLWPFWTHERYADGSEVTTAVFSAYRSSRSPRGDRALRLFPLGAWSHSDERRERRLTLFPLLYTRRRAPDAGHDAVLPLFARWRRGPAHHWLLWPVVHAAREPRSLPFAAIPVLLRVGWGRASAAGEPPADAHRAAARTARWRFGLPWILDLAGGSHTPESTAVSLGTLFPWGREGRSGLSFARWQRRPGAWSGWLFPLLAAGARERESTGADAPPGAAPGRERWLITALAGAWRLGNRRGVVVPPLLSAWRREENRRRLDVLFPLIAREASPERRHLRILPFWYADDRYDPERSKDEPVTRVRFVPPLFGRIERERLDDRRVDTVFPLLLSRWGESDSGDAWALDLLFPIVHASEDEEGMSVRLLPLLDRAERDERERLGVGLVLYRRYVDRIEERTRHWVLPPLVHWRHSPESSLAWAVPLWFSRTTRSPERRTRTTVLFPFFASHRDTRRRGEDAPWTVVGRELHLGPLVGRSFRRDLDGRTRRVTWHALFPFFRATRRTGDGDPRRPEVEVHAPWPLVRWRHDLVSWNLEARPLLRLASGPDRRRATLFPLFSFTGAGSDRSLFERSSFVQWHEREPGRDVRLFPLLFEWRERRASRRITGPLFWWRWRSGPDDGWFHVVPLGYGAWGPEGRSIGIFPFYRGRTVPSGPAPDWSPVELLFLWNRVEGEGEVRHSVLWWLVEASHDADGNHDVRVLHRLFVHREVHGQREWTLNPFWSWTRDERTGDETLRVLGFVWVAEREDGRVEHRLFGIPVGG